MVYFSSSNRLSHHDLCALADDVPIGVKAHHSERTHNRLGEIHSNKITKTQFPVYEPLLIKPELRPFLFVTYGKEWMDSDNRSK